MKELIRAKDALADELMARLGEEHQYIRVNSTVSIAESDANVLFDLDFESKPGRWKLYTSLESMFVFVHSLKTPFDPWRKAESDSSLIGMNGLPTFINRPVWELKVLDDQDRPAINELLTELGVECRWVKDRIGMVSARILFMIINEACYTFQEGTAGMADIDQAMRLGTNYPYGPFDWANRIGIKHVYETLEAIYQDTRDERYKICPLLKSQYLLGRPFDV